MNTPLLSVIVPVYNTEEYLSGFFSSILKTCTEKLELIFIDDGSSDNSGSIIDGYSAEHSFVHALHTNHSGPSAARNVGIARAHAEYLTFLDSDDYIDPAAFNRLLLQLEKTTAELWASDFRRVDDTGKLLDKVYQIEETAEPITVPGYLTQFLEGRECVWNVWRYVYGRKFLSENSLLFDESASIAEDLEFTVRVLTCVKKPVFFHNPYYNYRVNYGETLTRVYTADRVRQFTDMCLRAKETLDSADAPWTGKLRSKLAREFVLNLAVCPQVPKDERAAALEYCRASWSVLDGADCGIARLARAAEKAVGLRLTALVLYGMKMMKRAARHIKGYGK